MTKPQPEQPDNRRWTPGLVLQAFKEGVTATLGLAIVIFTLVLAGRVLSMAGDAAAMSAAKDILLLILSLAGVVIGYYFGRVPADARATQAEQSAAAAVSQAEQVSAQASAVADEIDDVLSASSVEVADALSRGATPPAEVIDATKLRSLRDRLRTVARHGGR